MKTYDVKEELDQLRDWMEGVRKRVRAIAEEWEGEEGNLIMILHAIQNEFGYIPRGVANELSKVMNVPMARIYEVITFYHYFRLTPPGSHTIQVCMGTACYLKGAEELHEELDHQVKRIEETGGPKGEFHLETVRCIGCCGMAPAVVIDGQTHGRLCPNALKGILETKRGA